MIGRWLVVVLAIVGAAALPARCASGQLADSPRREVRLVVGSADHVCSGHLPGMASSTLTEAELRMGCEFVGQRVERSGIFEFWLVMWWATGVLVSIAALWGGWRVARRVVRGAVRR